MKTIGANATGDESYTKLCELEHELHVLLDDMPNAGLGYPLADPATCQELCEAASALQRAVDLLGQASGRENPRYEAVADLIGEAGEAPVN